MQIAFKIGGNNFFKRYLPFCFASGENLTFKQLLACKEGVEVSFKERKRVLGCNLRDEEHAARLDLFTERGKCLP